MRTFNISGRCIPARHYMVCIDDKLQKIKAMVDNGDYFVINRARQYGKTTTLQLLGDYLKNEYIVISLDFQMMGNADFENERVFSTAFADYLLGTIKMDNLQKDLPENAINALSSDINKNEKFVLRQLFNHLSELCAGADKPVVLMIDEVDSAANNQVFLDFLAQLRAYYLRRDQIPTFQSVILAGVYDVRNLKGKIRPAEEHKMNSPWNIAEPFDVDMSLSEYGIADMLREYATDHAMKMDVDAVSHEIYEYTAGYPFLVSLICKIVDTNKNVCLSGSSAWSPDGVREAVKIILRDKTTLFDSMTRQLEEQPELRDMLHVTLFAGQRLAFNPYDRACELGTMFGYLKDDNGTVAISNRIFETWIYNYFLSQAQLTDASYLAASRDRNQFIRNGMLDMDMVLEKFDHRGNRLISQVDI